MSQKVFKLEISPDVFKHSIVSFDQKWILSNTSDGLLGVVQDILEENGKHYGFITFSGCCEVFLSKDLYGLDGVKASIENGKVYFDSSDNLSKKFILPINVNNINLSSNENGQYLPKDNNVHIQL
jgi:hypothetical protein